MGLLARFYKGSLTFSEMMKMKIKEIMFYYDIFERQSTIEKVINDVGFDKKTGKEKELPKPSRIRYLVDEAIKKRRENGG